jgi:hypothetical protein
MGAQVEEMSHQAQTLADTAQTLRELVARFDIGQRSAQVVPLRRAA